MDNALDTFASPSPADTRPSSPSQAANSNITLFNDPDGDVVLRTSDSVDFRVSKFVLKFASPVFETMFSLPQPPSEHPGDSDSTPIISISESSTTIDLLLRFLYPILSPDLVQENVSEILDVLCAGLKYEIDAVIEPARKAFRDRVKNGKEVAIAGYAAACHARLEDEARFAAKACLKGPIYGIEIPQLSLMSGSDYFNLLRYHDKAGNVVVGLFQQYGFRTVTNLGTFLPNHACSSETVKIPLENGSSSMTINVRRWLADSQSKMAADLAHAPLRFEKISLSTAASHFGDNHCYLCRDSLLGSWEQMRRTIISAIEREVDKVQLKVSWKNEQTLDGIIEGDIRVLA